MTTDVIKARLKALSIEPGEAIIVGSSLLAALGLRDSRDIDIMVDKSTFDRLAAVGIPVSTYADGTGKMVVGDTELMYSWNGKTIKDFLPDALYIDGIAFLSLEKLKEWKLRQNRPKDIRDIALIDKYQGLSETT